MPVQIDVFDFECFNQLRNGENFDRNLSEFTPNLVGNIGETVKVSYKANIQQSANTEGAEEWFIINDPSFKQIERSSGSFLEDGVQVGDFYLFFPDWEDRRSFNNEYGGVVEFISSDGKRLQYSVNTGTDSTSGTVKNVGLSFFMSVGTSANTALFVKFGLLSNDETFNFQSKTSEADQVYYIGGLDSDDIPRDAETLGTIKDWVTGEMTVEFTGEIPDFRGAQYRITHTFVLNPFYVLSYREFIENGTIPDLFAGENSIKYSTELEFRKTLTNTGSSKTQQFNSLGGFVGWYGENFNGLNADYRIVSVAYEDSVTGDTLGAININTSTKVTVEVENINGAITDYSCAAYIFRVPDSEDKYIGTATDLLENFLFKSEIVSSPDTASANITTSLVGGNLIIEYTVAYTVAEKLQLTTDDEFIVLVQVEDPTVAVGNSDRIMLLADFKNYVDVDFLDGFVDVESYSILQHGQVLDTDSGQETPTTSNEDGLLLDATVGVDTSKDVIINGITLKLLAFNSILGTSFDLDEYVFNLGDLLISGGVQQIEVDTTRGYVLPVGDEFNLVRITTAGQVGNYQQYSVQIGQKIKWQDWIFNPDVDGVFFDSTQPNNNLNEKASNYSGQQDYVIKIALVINVSGVDDLGRAITGDYIQYGGDIAVNDYGESDDGVSGVIQTFDLETGNTLQGNILYNGKDTLFKAVFSDAASMEYGIHRIEPSQNQGDGILEMSSLYLPSSDNLLKPLDGQTQLKYTLVGSELTTECLIDGSKIQEGVNYKLSARVGVSPLVPVLEFQTNKLPTGSDNNAFNPSITYSGADTPKWVFENGYEFEGAAVDDQDGVLTGLDGTTQTVQLIIEEPESVTGFTLDVDGITGVLNLSSLTSLNILSGHSNSGLTSVVVPASSFSSIILYSSGLTSIDLSGISFDDAATLNLTNNPNLYAGLVFAADYPIGSILKLDLQLIGIDDTIDLSIFDFANNTEIYLASNNSMQGVDFGDNLDNLKTFTAVGDTSLTSLDIRGVNFAGGASIDARGCSSLDTFLTDPSHTGSLGVLRLDSTILTTLDLSPFNFIDSFFLSTQGVPSLTSLDFGRVSADEVGTLLISSISVDALDLGDLVFGVNNYALNVGGNSHPVSWTPPDFGSGGSTCLGITISNSLISGVINLSSVDMSSIQGPSGGVGGLRVSSNPNITGVTLPSTVTNSLKFLTIVNNNTGVPNLDITNGYDVNNSKVELQDNNWTASEVNEALELIDSVTSGGFTGRTIDISGTNAAPDNTSGGFDGDAAITNLQGKGFTVTVTV